MKHIYRHIHTSRPKMVSNNKDIKMVNVQENIDKRRFFSRKQNIKIEI